MTMQVLTGSNINEIGAVSTQINLTLQAKDWTADTYFTGVVKHFGGLVIQIQDAVAISQKGNFTLNLKELDAIFDRNFLHLKSLLSAHLYHADAEIANKARKVMDKFETFDGRLYRLGYSEEIFLAISLIKELKEPDTKALMDALPGVPEAFQALEASTNALNAAYQDSKADNVEKDTETSASELKNVLRDYINDELVTYLVAMKRREPEIYSETCDLVLKNIEDSNTKVKSRLTRLSNKAEEEEETTTTAANTDAPSIDEA